MLGEADYDITEMAMNAEHGAQHAGDEKLGVYFYMRPWHNQSKSKSAGRPIYEEREYMKIRIPGDKDNQVDRPVTDFDRKRFQKRYSTWLENKTASAREQVEGTPFEVWGGVTASQAKELEFFGVFTVEQLAGMADTAAQGFMGINELRRKAQAYLEVSNTQAEANRLLEMEKAIELANQQQAEMARQLEASKQALEESRAQVGMLVEQQDAPKKRGRKPKEESVE